MTPRNRGRGNASGIQARAARTDTAAGASSRTSFGVLYRVLPNELGLGQDFLGAEA